MALNSYNTSPSDELDAEPWDDELNATPRGAAGIAEIARQIWSALYRNRLLILLIVALSIAAGVASVLLTPPKYQAHASVQIEQQATRVLGTEDTDPSATSAEADRHLKTQVDILQSRNLAKKVAESLSLYQRPDFFAAFGVKPASGDQTERRDQVIGLLQKNLSVTLPSNTRVVDILFTSRDPQLSATIANRYSETFIAENIRRRFSTSAYSREFLQSQLDQARQRLEQSERELVAYSRTNNLIDASAGMAAAPAAGDQARRSTLTMNLVQLNQSYATAQAARSQAEQRWNIARITPLLSLPEVVSNPAAQQLQEQIAELTQRMNTVRERYGPDHPTYALAQAQLDEAHRQVAIIATNIRNSIRAEFLSAMRQENALRERVKSLENATLLEQDRGVRYNVLKRVVDTNRQMYDELLNRYRAVSASAGVIPNNISVVDGADVPRKPISPRPALNLALAVLVGLFLAMGMVVVREFLDDTIRRPEDLENKLGLPLLGAVPKFKRATPSSGTPDEEQRLMTEAYQTISASIALSSVAGLPPTLLVTSSRKGEGKSTSAYMLAQAFAAMGKRTLLIDADLRSPSQHSMFAVDRSPGLTNVLAGGVSADAVIRETQQTQLFLMTAGAPTPNPAQLAGSPELGSLLADLSTKFDFILLDGPPMLALADAPQLASRVDATVLIVEANVVHFGQAKRVVRQLRSLRINLLGGALTKFDAKAMGYRRELAYYDYTSYGDDDAK